MHPRTPIPTPARQRGFTLVEALVTLAILGILAAIALPSMREMIARKRLEGAAQDVATDLRLLKSLRLQYPRDVGINFAETTDYTCYVLYYPGGGTVTDCNCGLSEASMCGGTEYTERPEAIKVVKLPKVDGVTVRSNFSVVYLSGANALPVQGLQLDVTLQADAIGAFKVRTNGVFSSSKCVASGSFGGVPACSTDSPP